MNETTPIIDVTPIRHSSSRIAPSTQTRSAYGNNTHGADSPFAETRNPFSQSYSSSWHGTASETARPWTPGSTVGGLAQMVAGASLILLGVPMLILPGPGLLSIAAGALLIARGASKLLPR